MPKRFITVLFGPLGDALMTLALYDEIVRAESHSTLLILTQRNAGMLRLLAREYRGIEVRELPGGWRALPAVLRVLRQERGLFIMLGLASARLSAPLRLFIRCFGLLPGNRTAGFFDPLFQTMLRFDVSHSVIENFRMLLRRALPEWTGTTRPPTVRLPQERPASAPEPSRYVVMHLSGVSIPHALPPERWRTLIRHMQKNNPELELLLTGTSAEEPVLRGIAEDLPVRVETRFSLPELVWLIKHATLYVGIDTGVTHIAGLLQRKSVVIGRCSDPSWAPTYNPYARVLLNTENCFPDERGRCSMVSEGGIEYRRCAHDISQRLLEESIDLALSSPAREVPLLPGVVNEAGR